MLSLIEETAGQGRRLCHGACASDAHLMNTAVLKRELALLRSSLAALTSAQSTAPDDAVAWAEGIAGLTAGGRRKKATTRPERAGQSRSRIALHSNPPYG